MAASPLLCGTAAAQTAASNPLSQSQSSPASLPNEKAPSPSVLPRGKKIILKDGGSEIASSYSVADGRVRYYSVERSQWEEIPSSMVDWDATHKEEAAEALEQSAQLASVKAHERELEARNPTLDVDASYEVAPGVFMPTGEGLFLVQGKGLIPLTQTLAELKTDKGRVVEKMLVPMPGLVPSRRNLELQGSRAKVRLQNPQPEFYLHTSEQREPRVELLLARVRGNSRVFESLDTSVGPDSDKPNAVRKSLALQSWAVAKGLYRYTLAQPLPHGEYVLTMLPYSSTDEASLQVWDFGLDASAN
jgi:hypothetical protein